MSDYFKQVIKRFLSLLDQNNKDKYTVEEIKLLLLQCFLDGEDNEKTKEMV